MIAEPVALTDALLLKLIDQGVATVCVAGLIFILYVVIVRFTRTQERLLDNLTTPDREREPPHPMDRRRTFPEHDENAPPPRQKIDGSP
jgi:hypothetical protein